MCNFQIDNLSPGFHTLSKYVGNILIFFLNFLLLSGPPQQATARRRMALSNITQFLHHNNNHYHQNIEQIERFTDIFSSHLEIFKTNEGIAQDAIISGPQAQYSVLGQCTALLSFFWGGMMIMHPGLSHLILPKKSRCASPPSTQSSALTFSLYKRNVISEPSLLGDYWGHQLLQM